MICDRVIPFALLLMLVSVGNAQSVQNDGETNDHLDSCSLWKPGMRYQTRISYDFTVKNCEIKFGKGYDVENGAYASPQITFRPIVEYVTEDVRRHGHNYSGMRTYAKPIVTLKGVGNLRWETTSSLVSWRRWAAWASRTHAAEWLAEKMGKTEILSLADFGRLTDKDQTTEEYLPFVMSNSASDGTEFNVSKEALFFEWSDRTFRQRGGDPLKVYIGSRQSDFGAFNKARSRAPESIEEIIRSEGDVSASAIFDRPGRGLALDPDRRMWTIDAGAINGLIQNDKLRKLINFSGTMTVRRKKIGVGEIAAKKMAPFDGTCVTVIDSSNMVVGYDTDQSAGNFQTFPVVIGENSDSSIEFWFDNVNETLRYAKVKIVNHDYEGNIPNPRLGENISKLKGRAKGDMSFVCVYTTEIQNKMYVLPPSEIMGKESGCVLKRFAKDRYLAEIRGRDLVAAESDNLYCWSQPDGGECDPNRSIKFGHVACHGDWCEFLSAKNGHPYDAWIKDDRIFLQERLQKNLSGEEYEFLLNESRLPMRTIKVPDPKGERNDAEVNFIKCAMPNGREYWLGETEVSQELWELVMPDNPSFFGSLNRPVDNASWSNAVVFCRNMSRLVGQTVRLPTAVEWWNACRAGRETADFESLDFSYNVPELSDFAWYGGNSAMGFELKEGHDASCIPSRQYSAGKIAGSHPIGRKKSNQWGFYDMLGNVSEICCEENGRDVKNSGVVTLLGGSWRDCAGVCVLKDGLKWPWGIGNGTTGLRLVLIPGQGMLKKIKHGCILKGLADEKVLSNETDEFRLKRSGTRIKYWINGQDTKNYSANVWELEHKACRDDFCVMQDKDAVEWKAVLTSGRLELSKLTSGRNLCANYVFPVDEVNAALSEEDARVMDDDVPTSNGNFSLAMAGQGDVFWEKQLYEPALRSYWQSDEIQANLRAAKIYRLGLPGVHKDLAMATWAYLYVGQRGDEQALLQGVLYQSLLMRRECCRDSSYANALMKEFVAEGRQYEDINDLGRYADFRWYSESNFVRSYTSFIARMKELGLAPMPSSPDKCYAILDTEGIFSPMSGVLLAGNGIYVINPDKGTCRNGFVAWDDFFRSASFELCNKGRDWPFTSSGSGVGVNDIGSHRMIKAFLCVAKYLYDRYNGHAVKSMEGESVNNNEPSSGENRLGCYEVRKSQYGAWDVYKDGVPAGFSSLSKEECMEWMQDQINMSR